MNKGLVPLPDGGRVVIIGGGPGGTACALALQRLGRRTGRKTHILLLEGKQFAGERHYNQCMGVLSPPLPSLLEDHLGLAFPRHLSRGEINGYVLHTAGERVVLDGGEGHPSHALRRVQFDAYMMEAVKKRGVRVLSARAVDLEFHANHVVVFTEGKSLEADVVVGAFGLDEGSAAMFGRLTPYLPPQAMSSVLTKYHPGAEGMAVFGGRIQAFLPRHSKIEFGAVTPKGNHLIINIAGLGVDVPLMQAFLAIPDVRAVLPDFEPERLNNPDGLRYFKGRFPRSRARGYYGDRYVMVGDAAGLVRAFKGKGVTSAVLTGLRAAETILQRGISAQAFHDHYRKANQDIIGDLPYGRGVRLLTIFASRLGLLDPVLRAAKHDPRVSRALFGAVSAHESYRQILARMLRPGPAFSVLRCLFEG